MLNPAVPRQRPTGRIAAAILEAQRGRCFYCGIEIGSLFEHGTDLVCAALCWDHVVPYAYCANSSPSNFVAACQQCNTVKSDKVFDTESEIKEYVRIQRIKKGLPVRIGLRSQAQVAKVLQSKMPNRRLLEDAQGGRCYKRSETQLELYLPRRRWKIRKQRKPISEWGRIDPNWASKLKFGIVENFPSRGDVRGKKQP